jgi:hypothetical protein
VEDGFVGGEEPEDVCVDVAIVERETSSLPQAVSTAIVTIAILVNQMVAREESRRARDSEAVNI